MTKYWFIFLFVLIAMLLGACGGSSTPQPAGDFPLPAGAEAQMGAEPTEIIPTLQTASVPLTYTLPAMQPGESITLDLAASLEQLQPPLMAPAATAEIYLSLVISSPQATPTTAMAPDLGRSAPLVTEPPLANAGIMEAQPPAAVSPAWVALMIPGVTCLLGILLFVLGITMVTTASKPAPQIISVIRIADLQPGMGTVELQGTISDIPRPLDKNPTSPLAVLRLVIEQNDPGGGWKVVLDRVKTTEFSLKDGDGGGTVWISPEQLDLSLLGDGSVASISQAEEALKILGLRPSSAWGKGLRYRIWELRGGQTLIAVGDVQQQLHLSGSPANPLTLSLTGGIPQAAAKAPAPQKRSSLLLILVFALGALFVLAALAYVLVLLLS